LNSIGCRNFHEKKAGLQRALHNLDDAAAHTFLTQLLLLSFFHSSEGNNNRLAKMGYSTKNMHIFFANSNATDGSFAEGFMALPRKDFEKLIEAVNNAIGRGAMMDLTMIVTLCGHVILDDIDFADLVVHIKRNKDVARLTTVMPDLISLIRIDGFMVNIRLIGTKKFVALLLGEENGVNCNDDSFESVEEELTQQCNLITARTPYK
jgi:hypothetical protein